MRGFTARVVVVTGAGSGIGRALALELAERGARISVSDNSVEDLSETVAQLARRGHGHHACTVDVTDRLAIRRYAAAVSGEYGTVNQVYNNAGSIAAGTGEHDDGGRYESVLAANLLGVINGTREFLPYLIASGEGHVVNISGLDDMTSRPEWTAFCASKYGVRGFTEALAYELAAAGHAVRTSMVHPEGFAVERSAVCSRVPENAFIRRFGGLHAERRTPSTQDAARTILDGVAAGRSRILVGCEARASDFLMRVFPSHAIQLSMWLRHRLRP